MPHSKVVIRLNAADNPPNNAPPYPGKWSRQNHKGITKSKTEYYQEVTNLWLEFVKEKPGYKSTFMADQAKALSLHLGQSKKKGRGAVTHLQCREFITRAEKRLREIDHPGEEGGRGQVGQEQGQGMCEAGGSQQADEAMVVNDNIEIGDTGRDQVGVLSESSDDDDWMNKPDRKERVEQVFVVKKFLEKTDEEVFESGITVEDIFGFSPEYSSIFKTRREEYARKICEQKTDRDIFESEQIINDHIKKSVIYQERQKAYCNIYFEENFQGASSQDILSAISQTPQIVIDSEVFKNSLSHLTRKEKSEMIIMKSVRETVKALNESPSKEGKHQKKVLGASVASLRFGVPDIGLTVREEQESLEMKRKLLGREETVLKESTKAARQIFPPEVCLVKCSTVQCSTVQY